VRPLNLSSAHEPRFQNLRCTNGRKSKGEAMIIPATAGRRRFKRNEVVQDIQIVLSFCLWAVLLGVVPTMALRALAGG